MLKKLPLSKFIYFGVGLNIFTIIVTILIKDFLPPIVPLYFGLPGGRTQLAPFFNLFLLPAISILIIVINLLLAHKSKDDFIKKVLILSSFVVSIISTIAVVKIILLVGFF